MTSPIETAVAPLKIEAADRAEQEARSVVERVTAALESAGFDLDIAAPYPSATMPTGQYEAMRSRIALFSNLTTNRVGHRSYGAPQLVDIDSAKVERFVQDAREDAAIRYEEFTAKLNAKIGPCVSADLSGNHVWSHSILTVTKEDGSVERWKTQMILNCSKLGKVFNQFPTRKIK